MRLTLLLLLLSPWALLAGVMDVYSFGPDSNGYPIAFLGFDARGVDPPAALGSLGDGSRFFNGGLVRAGGRFYAIGNDATYDFHAGNALVSFTDPLLGASEIASLDPYIGWTGGLAFLPAADAFYTIADTFGIPTLYSIGRLNGVVTPLAAVGDGSLGFSGLAYNTQTGLLYAIANGALEDQLMSIDPLAPGPASQVFSLGGNGYLGGLAYNPLSDVFYTVQSQGIAADAWLVKLSLANGGSIEPVSGLGVQGLLNHGLVFVPEPSAAIPYLTIFAGAVLVRRSQTQKRR